MGSVLTVSSHLFVAELYLVGAAHAGLSHFPVSGLKEPVVHAGVGSV